MEIMEPRKGMEVVLVCPPGVYHGCVGECFVYDIKQSDECGTCVLLENIKSHKRTLWLRWEGCIKSKVIRPRLR